VLHPGFYFTKAVAAAGFSREKHQQTENGADRGSRTAIVQDMIFNDEPTA
jgi:hypothetical protein